MRFIKFIAFPVLCIGLLTGCEGNLEVEAVSPRRGEIRESFREPARTRLAKTYPITMPVSGRLARIDLEPGDEVIAGQLLVEIDLVPFREAAAEAKAAIEELEAEIEVKEDNRLENTALDEALAAVKAAAEALNAANAKVDAEKAFADRMAKELTRKETLAKESVIAEDQLDDAKLGAETSLIKLREEEFNRAALKAIIVAVNLGPRAIEQFISKKGLEKAVLEHRLVQARSRLARAEHELKLAQVRSPIDGVVLERREQGDRWLAAGSPLLLLGNLEQLEVVADVLTQDALRLDLGSEVLLEPASGLPEISGKVKQIEPAGFTKLSSLGVEQQRVKVIVDFAGPHERIGVAYRLHARFLTGSKKDALIVPRFSVLQAPDRSFYVLKIEGGRLKQRTVMLGLKSDLEMEVVEGVNESDVLVARPDATMRGGAKVKVIDG